MTNLTDNSTHNTVATSKKKISVSWH